MPNIKILPDIIANKIAAGEVIERPASVVKELVENSIDAGASKIIVDVEKGGRRLIRVSDNGLGMDREDALLSIERYATSKIENISDIDNIVTLGFRGEALPSILSVSHTVIATKRKEDVYGTRLIINGGILKNVTDAGRDEGTDVEVKDLFFNLPARRKFLKTENTELQHIKNIIYNIAVSSPGLSLTLNSNSREIVSYKGSADSSEMLHQIFSASLTKLMVPIKFSVDSVDVEGFLGKPETARNTGSNSYIIMNGRPITSRSISRAVFEGYGSTIVRGMFPVFVLYFEIDPSRIDVNVHPTKREIRIFRDFVILQALKENVAKTIQSMDAVPELGTPQKTFIDFSKSSRPITIYNPPDDRWQQETPKIDHARHGTLEYDSQGNLLFGDKTLQEKSDGFPLTIEKGADSYEGPAFWQLKDRYIITTIKEGAL